MKVKIAAAAIPVLVLLGAVTLPACQTALDNKPDAAKTAEPARPVLVPRAEPISATAAANMGNNCFACHGPEGKSPGSIPSLNGKNADAIVKTMNDFKSGARPSTVMGRHAKGYTDAEIAAIAKYISSFK